MEIDEQSLEWVPYMPGTTIKEYPVLSRIGCHRSHRNKPRGLWHNRQAGK